jgi:phosphoserine phosphatase
MNYKSFSPSFWEHLSKCLDQELAVNKNPVAAFDADGTLWDTDLGEAFFKWQIKNSGLPDLPADPWKHYRDMKASGDPRPAYLWLAQINQGQKFSDVQNWANRCVEQMQPLPIFEDQKKLIELFLKNNVQIYIVTASVKWAVEPGARFLGLQDSNVLGVATTVENGIVTYKNSGEITYREGKLIALLNQTKGVKPFFASGNSPGDSSLLGAATRLSLVVGATKPGHELFLSEEKLREEGRSKNWWVHKF